jgi:hypothetical protein
MKKRRKREWARGETIASVKGRVKGREKGKEGGCALSTSSSG